MPAGDSADRPPGPPPGPSRTRRVGFLGTFVWDTIHHPHLPEPRTQWGGLAYCASAFAAACPRGWEAVPIARVGADLAEGAIRFLRSLSDLQIEQGLDIIDAPNNRVELRYGDGAERTELLRGGVPPWDIASLVAAVSGLDALYVNHMSGQEMDLAAARGLRDAFDGRIYADLHSLFLSPPSHEPRRPRSLPDCAEWVRCADIVQLNEVELGWTGLGGAEALIGPPPAAVLVTRGAAGASVALFEGEAEVRARVIPLPHAPLCGDPTGCGDVWGSVAFCGLLEGLPLEQAVTRAHVAAAARIRHGRLEGLADAIGAALTAWDAGL